jgi:steroid delta-isomerase-like uncharacterized protein
MSLEENKALVRRHSQEFWSQGDLSVSDEIHAPDIVSHDPASPDMNSAEAYKEFVTMYRTAFPDLTFTIEALFAEGEWVAQLWSAVGTHQGELMGVAPTGNEVRTTGIGIFRMAQGRIVEEWENWSTLSMLQQLGIVPPMGEAEE